MNFEDLIDADFDDVPLTGIQNNVKPKVNLIEDKPIIKKKIIKKEPKKYIIIGGKKVYYTSNEELQQKLKATSTQIKNIEDNKMRYIYNQNTGDFAKFKPDEKPLLFQEFGINRVSKKYFFDDVNIKRKIDGQVAHITINNNGISYGTPLNITIYCKFRCYWYDDSMYPKEHKPMKEIAFDYNLIIFDSEDDIKTTLTASIKDSDPRLSDVYFVKIEDIKAASLIDPDNYFEITKMGLKRDVPLKIDAFGKQEIEILPKEENCVHNLLLKKFKISSKSIKSIGDEKGVNVEQIKEFCIKYNIKMIAYDINLNVISAYYAIKSKHPSLIFIAYNNHIYEIDNNYLKQSKIQKYDKTEYVNDLKEKLIEFLDNEILPSNINYDGLNIRSFIVSNVLYHTNEDYDICKEILSKFGLLDKLNCSVTLCSISKIIEQLYTPENVNSFFPYKLQFNAGYNFVNKNMDSEDLKTIDNNKHYSHVLKTLPYLFMTDIRYAKYESNPQIIKKNFVYIAKPTKSTILMPITDFYFGEYLIYCKNEGIEFTIKEGLECFAKNNYYTKMIDDLYNKLTPDIFKKVVNRMIGNFNGNDLNMKQQCVFNKIANEDETNTSKSHYMILNDKYNLLYDIVDKSPNLYSKVLIRLQILTESRKIIYNKMKDLKLTSNDIKQIKTDSITFICKNKELSNLGTEIGLWKEETKKEYFKESIFYVDEDFSMNKNLFDNTIYIDYAGSGKTHHIINKLIPTIDDYIVLTPSHSALKDYRRNKINCSVIQKYSYNNDIPDEKIIIVDEIGMVNRQCNDILIKSAILGKKIYCFGDFKQLAPVNDNVLNGELYLNMMYKTISSLGTNFRNDFTFEYYESLLNGNQKYIIEQVKKYNCKSFENADVIISYTNDMRNGNDNKKITGYNQKMLEHLGLNHGDVGTKIVCKTNDLHDKKIYNNFYYSVVEIDNDDIIISDDIDNIKISKKDFDKYFESGYCRTLYNIQGESVKSFYFPEEDMKYLNNVSVYTLISRLKTK